MLRPHAREGCVANGVGFVVGVVQKSSFFSPLSTASVYSNRWRASCLFGSQATPSKRERYARFEATRGMGGEFSACLAAVEWAGT